MLCVWVSASWLVCFFMAFYWWHSVNYSISHATEQKDKTIRYSFSLSLDYLSFPFFIDDEKVASKCENDLIDWVCDMIQLLYSKCPVFNLLNLQKCTSFQLNWLQSCDLIENDSQIIIRFYYFVNVLSVSRWKCIEKSVETDIKTHEVLHNYFPSPPPDLTNLIDCN